MVEHADLISTGLHQLDRAAVVARVADAREDLVGLFAERLADEMLGEEPPGGRRARTERKRLALDTFWKLLGERETSGGMSDDVTLEFEVLRSLGNGLRSRHGEPRLHTRQAAEPGKLHLIVGEGGDSSRIALHRQIFDGHTQLAFEILGVLAEPLDEPRFVLIGNSGEHQRGLLRARHSSSKNAQESNGKTQSLEHRTSLYSLVTHQGSAGDASNTTMGEAVTCVPTQVTQTAHACVTLRRTRAKSYRTAAVPMKATPPRPIGPVPKRVSRLSTNRWSTPVRRSPRPASMAAMPGAKPMRSESQRADGT